MLGALSRIEDERWCARCEVASLQVDCERGSSEILRKAERPMTKGLIHEN